MAMGRLQFAAVAFVSTAALVLLGSGCDDDTSTTPAGTVSGTTTGTGSGTGGGTGGVGGSGGTGGTGTGVGGEMPDGIGMVMGMSGSYLYGDSSMAMAFFAEVTGGGPSTCTETTEGDCLITTCDVAAGGGGGTGGAGGAGGAPPSPHAGDITITGGVRDVTLTPDADGTYPPDSSLTELLFNGGQTITIAAAGDEVAAFSEQLTAPSLVTVTAPDFTGGDVTIPTSSDFVVTWTGGTDGDVMVSLSGSDSSDSVSVVCTYAATAGTGTVPAAALDDLLPFGTGGITIANGETLSIMTTNNWQVILTLSSSGATSTSATGMAVGTTTYQ